MTATAETYARAIIASAVSLGELTPLRQRADAITANAYLPASVALALETKVAIPDVCQVLQIGADAVVMARRDEPKRFKAAQEAAREAIRYHLKARTSERPQAALEPAPEAVAAPTEEPAAPPPERAPAPTRVVRLRPRPVVEPQRSRRPAGRAIPKGATFENRGDGVSIIRLKPITDSIVRHAAQQIAKGVEVEELADLFCVADALRKRLEGVPA